MSEDAHKVRLRYRLSTYTSFFRMLSNWILHLTARFMFGGYVCVGKTIRPALHRMRGVKISGTVYIGDDVYLDEDCPGSLEIHDGAVIAPRCTIIGHTRGEGKIIIGKRAAIGAGCLIVCGPGQTLTIGEGSVVAAGSVVSQDIPPFTLCGAPRIVMYGKVTVPFTLAASYEEFRRGLRPLRKDPETERVCK